jgi:hypothetical protein
LVDFNLHIPSNLLLFMLMSLLATAEISTVASAEKQGNGKYRKRVRVRRTEAITQPASA